MEIQRGQLIDRATRDGRPWAGSPYYAAAEKHIPIFWSHNSPFRELFDQLDISRTLELACGHGRHLGMTAALERCNNLIGMDLLEENISACSQRYAGDPKITLVKNNGIDFNPISDSSLDSIYCYDAMVHFDSDVVFSYLRDTFRILRPGGKALYHHSNYIGAPGSHYGQNPHARNFMSKEFFAHYAVKSGLLIVDAKKLRWGDQQDIDCITLVLKPG
jgi:SAM-dependent methyltransferase